MAAAPINTNRLNRKARAGTEASLTKFDAFRKYMETAKTADWDVTNEKRQQWNSRWNRTIEK